jgi:pantoate--beta-alanine ligase
MLRITTIAGVRSRREELRRLGRKVALVPTMGALHEGHRTLVRRGEELAEEVWASVFVNPTQFGPGEDFERYPRDLDRDAASLESWGVSLLFAPTTKEMYPRPPAVVVDPGDLAAGMCGAFRPGHFRGVASVVAKLLNIVQPDVAVFGAKDWQQSVVIRRLVTDLDLPVRIEVAATAREADGLAMSSRNAYLTTSERAAAAVLYRALKAGEQAVLQGERDATRVGELVATVVAGEPEARLQYVAVVNPDTCKPLQAIGGRALLALAVFIGQTRLIDNALVEVAP